MKLFLCHERNMWATELGDYVCLRSNAQPVRAKVNLIPIWLLFLSLPFLEMGIPPSTIYNDLSVCFGIFLMLPWLWLTLTKTYLMTETPNPRIVSA